jgi:hypothetical protein
MVAKTGQDEWWTHGLWTIDATHILAPALVAHIPVVNGAQQVAISGDFAYVASPDSWSPDPVQAALVVVDISDPGSPAVKSRVKITDVAGSWDVALAVDGHYVYLVATGYASQTYRVTHHSLYVVDVQDPQRPLKLVELPLEVPAFHVATTYGYALLPGNGGVLVIDVRDPAHPVPVGILPTGADGVVDVTVEEGIVYASTGAGGLFVFVPQLEGWPIPELPATPSPTPQLATATSETPATPTPTPRAATATPTNGVTADRLFLPKLENRQ